MSWSKSDAEAYLAGTKTLDDLSSGVDDSQVDTTNNETSVEDAASSESVQPTADKPQEVDTSVEEKTASSDKVDNPEKIENDVKDTKKSKAYTTEEKTKHAFAKQKSKYVARLEAKQKEIDALNEKLKKYEGLTLKHFHDDQEAYNDYKLDRRFDEEKVRRLQDELNTEQAEFVNEESAENARAKLEACYPNEEDQVKFQKLIQRAETSFDTMHPNYGCKSFTEFLLKETDHSIISYLQDSDNAPKLIRHFIHKPEVAERIMRMSNPYNKIIELKQLENRMLLAERMQAKKNEVVEKKTLPNTGKVVTTAGQNTGERDWTKPISRHEAEMLMKQHKY